jgi:O-antigen ligase
MRRTTPASHPQAFSTGSGQGAQTGFAMVAGIFLFLVVVKFGDPVILDAMIVPPENWLEAVYESWRLKWAYWMLVPVLATGLLVIRWKRLFHPNLNPNPSPGPIRPPCCNRPVSKVLLFFPLIWLVWQFIAAAHTVSPALTAVTLGHFTTCVALFYLAYLALGGISNPWPLWAGLALALAWVIRAGFDQHFGGLEATRRMVYEMPNWRGAGPEYLKRLASDRIFSTFMYPNALAGGLLLLLPLSLVFVWLLTPKVGVTVRRAFVIILGGCGLACLYWSGSKAGWLVMLATALIVLLHLPLQAPGKHWLICGIIVIGLAGFAARYAKFFERGSTSVVARFDYWAAAARIAREHPIFGTGPGTFSVAYRKVKNPSSEMAQLVHNDYLEQASDSGIVGFLSFFAMIIGLLTFLYRCRIKKHGDFYQIHFAVWLGLVGLFLHSIVEFHLYYPAFAWPAFFLMGWMFGLDEPQVTG